MRLYTIHTHTYVHNMYTHVHIVKQKHIFYVLMLQDRFRRRKSSL